MKKLRIVDIYVWTENRKEKRKSSKKEGCVQYKYRLSNQVEYLGDPGFCPSWKVSRNQWKEMTLGFHLYYPNSSCPEVTRVQKHVGWFQELVHSFTGWHTPLTAQGAKAFNLFCAEGGFFNLHFLLYFSSPVILSRLGSRKRSFSKV